ncbi:hypothetical protein M9H77_14094 [Catharanthus roseus]|uniref:Uncharacterized protein n=1 Tax=Catharanthus roseus TaxID=4058 RepID=A0ACC0BM16_CATRO|nr:hypothetical protein M9H77_14094 [Catharanthus roseus]
MRNNVNMVKEEIKSTKLTFLNHMGWKILFKEEIVGFSSPCSPNIFHFPAQFLLPLFLPNDVSGPQPWSRLFLTGSRDARAIRRVSHEEKKKERNRERGLPVISVSAESFSEVITPDHSLAYLRRLDAALPLLSDRLYF